MRTQFATRSTRERENHAKHGSGCVVCKRKIRSRRMNGKNIIAKRHNRHCADFSFFCSFSLAWDGEKEEE
jgi:hypothetical protein